MTPAVLFIDLDNFKTVNDSLGHSAGDQLLRSFAHRLVLCTRAGDTVARLGGDEFAVLLENVDERHVIRVALKILHALEQPIDYADQPLDVGSSIGIAHFPEHGENSSKLLRNADIAMYVAKRNKSGHAVFDASYDTHQQQHLSLLSEIRQAVDGNQLRVYYQPKIGLASAVVEGVEALLRWEHPRRGFVSPADFIPFAEHTGYIKVLTRWVLEEAIRQCEQWRASGISLRVSVNISARDLLNRELPEYIEQLLDRYGTPASLLCLEITESGFMEDPAHSLRVLQRLLGCDQAQGYFMSRPLPVKELEEWLRHSPWATAPKRFLEEPSNVTVLKTATLRKL
jgi:diguanylate cyclase (GGDEF)-like protein